MYVRVTGAPVVYVDLGQRRKDDVGRTKEILVNWAMKFDMDYKRRCLRAVVWNEGESHGSLPVTKHPCPYGPGINVVLRAVVRRRYVAKLDRDLLVQMTDYDPGPVYHRGVRSSTYSQVDVEFFVHHRV